MNRCYLSLGSNLNSPQRQLRQAITSLRQLPATSVIKVAKFYPNKAWGRKAQPHFYNTVVLLHTLLKPNHLLRLCQNIEKKQGRIRKIRWSSRTLDIDILTYGSLKSKSKRLTLPHPGFYLRDFVLIPFFDIAEQNIQL